jgi:hypothetical protein
MATNCTSEEINRQPADRDEVLHWVASALRSERLMTRLHENADEPTQQ